MNGKISPSDIEKICKEHEITIEDLGKLLDDRKRHILHAENISHGGWYWWRIDMHHLWEPKFVQTLSDGIQRMEGGSLYGEFVKIKIPVRIFGKNNNPCKWD